MVFERKYSPELRERAVAEVAERRAQRPGDRAVIREVADEFSIGEQSLRIWVRRASASGGENESSSDLGKELAELRSEIEALRRENRVLKKAFKIFTSDWDDA